VSLSLRSVPGLPQGRVRLLADVLGYRSGRVPARPDGSPATLSLRSWIRLRRGNSFNLNVIAIGSDAFTPALWTEVEVLVHRMREVYAQIGVGVRIVSYFGVPVTSAHGLYLITTDDEIDDLRSTWSVPNTGIDLFVPLAWMNATVAGRSPDNGACPGHTGDGAGIGLLGVMQSARTASHEIGHYLSLGHENDRKRNLMCQSDQAAAPIWQSVSFTTDQADDVRSHCMVRQS
jgi:hypothetical protein